MSEGASECAVRRSLHGAFLRVKSKVNPEEEGLSVAPLVLSLYFSVSRHRTLMRFHSCPPFGKRASIKRMPKLDAVNPGRFTQEDHRILLCSIKVLVKNRISIT